MTTNDHIFITTCCKTKELPKEGIMKKSLIISLAILTFHLFPMGLSQNVSAQVIPQDSLALVSLYDSTNGASWTDNTNWLSVQSVSNWFGISVSNGRVTRISLDLNNLSGTIPPDFANLTGLTYLNLERNDISGPFPQQVLSLTGLTDLIIRNNNFTGSIPNNIDTLANLTSLLLFNNPLTGHLPPELGNLSKLTNIRIGATQIDGPIPPEIGKLTSLNNLGLRSNKLSGIIPAQLGDLINLDNLELYGNELTGEIPVELGNLVKLRRLFLQSNHLEGSIPVSFGNLINLENLQLQTNNLTGTIPNEFGNLDSIRIMFLAGNQLSGSVPDEIVNLSKLERFQININELTSLPLLSGLTSITEIYIQDNKFTFKDIEQNIGIATTFIYSPQDSIGLEQDTIVNIGSGITITVSAGGVSTKYQWMKGEVEISGATDSSYSIDSADFPDTGAYICKVTNTIAADLTLYSRPVNVTVVDPASIQDKSTQIPGIFVLHQNYPNPFNPKTTISWQLPISDFVDLSIYDIHGKKITMLLSSKQAAGNYKTTFDGSFFASGIYFAQLRTNTYSKIIKMVLLR
jgi:Leucine-rich repeat (LRR) protein